MDNVVDFKPQQKEDDCSNCEHCKRVNDIADEFLSFVKDLDVKDSEFKEEVELLIRHVEKLTEKDILASIGFELLEMSGVIDES